MDARDDTPPPRRWPWRRLAAAMILAAAGLHVAYLTHDCPLDLAPDEAHYWDWSRHPDWSYYSKGPLVALLIRGSCELFGPWSESVCGSPMIAIRFPAVVCGALLLASAYVLTVQTLRSEKLAAVGRLISGVVNDLQTPLEAIYSMADSALEQHTGSSPGHELLVIASEARRATALVTRLVSFAQPE